MASPLVNCIVNYAVVVNATICIQEVLLQFVNVKTANSLKDDDPYLAVDQNDVKAVRWLQIWVGGRVVA